jgi:hypothetical protein
MVCIIHVVLEAFVVEQQRLELYPTPRPSSLEGERYPSNLAETETPGLHLKDPKAQWQERASRIRRLHPDRL